jgi:hypothetical protein
MKLNRYELFLCKLFDLMYVAGAVLLMIAGAMALVRGW